MMPQAGLQDERRAWEDDLYDLGTLLRLADTVHENGDAPADTEGGEPAEGADRIAAGPDGHPFASLAAKTLVRLLISGFQTKSACECMWMQLRASRLSG